MRFIRPITALAAAAIIGVVPASSLLAQRQQPTPEQRIERLERQVDEVQRRVFPKGRPADTAGFADDPAATQSSVVSIAQRLDALERQLADLVRQTEENGSRVRNIETAVGQLRRDTDQRISALQQRIDTAATAAPPAASLEPAPQATTPAKPKPSSTSPKPNGTTAKPSASTTTAAPNSGSGLLVPASDPAEDAYTAAFRLWEAGQYDEAISQLRAFVSAYPKHRRVSYANNLIGRALLDKGDARAAATAFIANYRGNPSGERAQDSLYYLGQALMKLGQPSQACNAYAELDSIYGAKIRPDLKKLEDEAKAQAQCG